MSKIDYEIDLIIEIERLNSLYLHYKNLYRKLILLCCSDQRQVAKTNRNYYKNLLKVQKEKLKLLKEPNY